MYLRFILLPLYFFAALLSPPVSAASVTLTQDGAVAYALKHNPGLASARLGLEEARGRLQQSGRLGNPELELEWNKTLRSSEGGARVAFMQRFPVTGRLRYEKAVSRAQVAAAEFEVGEAERLLAADVRGISVKLIALQQQRELRSNQIANLRELSEFLRKSAEAGEGARADVLQVELEAQLMEIESRQLEADAAVLLGEFRVMLGALPGESMGVSGQLAPPAARAHGVGSAQGLEVLAAQSRAEAARFTLREQQARRVEDIGAGLSFSQERTIDDPNPAQTERVIGFRITVPLPLWNNNAGRIHEATAAVGRAEKEVEVARLTVASEREAARQAMEAYESILKALDARALPQVLQLQEQLQAGHLAGQTPLLEVLRTRSRHLELQRQRLDVLRDYHLARIRYGAAVPQPFFSK